ncbi:MAG: hypothetical protein LUE08_09175 [Akkermansiaceae bacterium]|nr:hypothetical protein [Akkermansiaceae bacterium]
MKSYTPSLIGWAALFPIFCSTIIDKSFQFPKFVYIILGAALFIGQFASLLWGLGGSIVNARKKNDLIALLSSGIFFAILIIGFTVAS